MKKFVNFFPAMLLFTGFSAAAQTQLCDSVTGTRGQVNIIADPALEIMLTERKEQNKETETIPGYRLQVFFGSNREEAMQMQNRVSSRFKDTEVYLVYEQPYFKVRVGDYRTRMEALKMFFIFKDRYDSVILTPDKINLPPL